MYARQSGNITGMRQITCPEGHTWESFAHLLLESMPERTRTHYENKIAVFLHWWEARGYRGGVIPDEADAADEAAKRVPSWRRICKALLRNDYWCKGLSFTQHRSAAYDKYLKVMKNRRSRWGLI
jgi:predicted phosphoadenosine phosphosulfate sulfurtransferase